MKVEAQVVLPVVCKGQCVERFTNENLAPNCHSPHNGLAPVRLSHKLLESFRLAAGFIN